MMCIGDFQGSCFICERSKFAFSCWPVAIDFKDILTSCSIVSPCTLCINVLAIGMMVYDDAKAANCRVHEL